MTKDIKQEIVKSSKEEFNANMVLLRNISSLLSWFSLLLFICLTITCMASWRVDPIAIVIGYWLVLLTFSAGYLIKKTIKNSTLPVSNYGKGELRAVVLSTIRQMKQYIGLKSKQEIQNILQDWSFLFLATAVILLGVIITTGTILILKHLRRFHIRMESIALQRNIKLRKRKKRYKSCI